LAILHGIVHKVYPFLNSENEKGYDETVSMAVDQYVHFAQVLLVWILWRNKFKDAAYARVFRCVH
jgi:hypothetical protein